MRTLVILLAIFATLSCASLIPDIGGQVNKVVEDLEQREIARRAEFAAEVERLRDELREGLISSAEFQESYANAMREELEAQSDAARELAAKAGEAATTEIARWRAEMEALGKSASGGGMDALIALLGGSGLVGAIAAFLRAQAVSKEIPVATHQLSMQRDLRRAIRGEPCGDVIPLTSNPIDPKNGNTPTS